MGEDKLWFLLFSVVDVAISSILCQIFRASETLQCVPETFQASFRSYDCFDFSLLLLLLVICKIARR